MSFCATYCVFLAAVRQRLGGVELDIAAFFILAVAGLEVFGVILGGYASGSKWSLYGAMREAAQVVSYEIPLGLCVVVPVLISGSMDLVDIGQFQRGWFWNWNLLHDPFAFVTFWVYITCAVASTNRAPFDLPEAESELVAGFLTEYSGFRWVIFFMAEYAAMFVVMGLAAILFLGGWNGPLPVTEWLRLTPTPHHEVGAMAGWATCWGCAISSRRRCFGVIFMIWLRWTLPRLRIDQVMTTCLKYCVPLGSAMLAGVMLWMYFLPDGAIAELRRAYAAPTRTDPPAGKVGKVGWVERSEPHHCESLRFRWRLAARTTPPLPPSARNDQFAICNLQFAILFPAGGSLTCRRPSGTTASSCCLQRSPAPRPWRWSLPATSSAWPAGWWWRWRRSPGCSFWPGPSSSASVQLMVYVGGTMVLLIFGVMLTARGPFVSLKISSGQWVVAIFIAGRCWRCCCGLH